MRGYTELFEFEIHKRENVPTAVRELQESLAEHGKKLNAIKESITTYCQDHRETVDYDEQLEQFRLQAYEPVESLLSCRERILKLKPELELISPDVAPWIAHIANAIHDIWAVIDVLTTPSLELPAYVGNWLRFRNSIDIQTLHSRPDALAYLHEALQNPISEIRLEAAILLRRCPDKQSVPSLIAVLHDTDPIVRGEAAETLGMLGDQSAIEPLIECLKYRDSRWGPAWALGQLRDLRAVEALSRALEEEMADLNGPPRFLRVTVNLRNALEAIGGLEAEKTLKRFWPNGGW